MADLIVRAYQVRFGDAIFIEIPEDDGTKRRILIDFGNALGTAGGQDDVFEPVIDDLIAVLGGQPLDLYVMTHEHLDHVQGLFYASTKLNKTLTARQVWLTGSADPHYYDTHAGARKQKIAALTAYRAARLGLLATASRSAAAEVLLANNNPRATAECIAFLRTGLAAPGDVHYVDREFSLATLQPSTSATLGLWAPEENTADYYRRFAALARNLQIADAASVDDAAALADAAPDPDVALAEPLAGIDAGAFYNLLDLRHTNAASTLLEIDKAANNTSVVIVLEWKGWRLLFAGDAEQASWKMMDVKGVIEPVHFLKVSHHGSKTGLPPDGILDKLLPVPPPDVRPRRAVVSTFENTYPGVPDTPTLDAIAARAELHSTEDLAANERFVEIAFPAM